MSSRLPVTLIGGFLGAGKTSLLHQFISEHQGGHLAVLVENPGPLNLDAKAIHGLCGMMRRTQDAVFEIPDGDAALQTTAIANCLRDIARAGRHERVLIELAGTSSPAWLAREFFPGGAIAPHAELSQIVCVVDALEFFRSGLKAPSSANNSWYFRREQIAGATLIVLNKCDLLDEQQRRECHAELHRLLPGVRIIQTTFGELPPEILLAPASPEGISAALERRAKVPEGDLGSISAALYRVHRPFHPQRFWDWFDGDHPGLLRVKGIIWLASRNLLVGGVSRTVWQDACGAAGIWWAALPREEWPQEPAALVKMQETWREPYGDRRQELIAIGNPAYLSHGLRRELDACLLTDTEYSRPPAEWGRLPDPFPVWDLEGHPPA